MNRIAFTILKATLDFCRLR